ncbi:MAG: DUF885 domain-containing protein [Elusimicrobiota bacterium]|nr:MAG: DUF885 domain-containing protein [Elusimicrobiota bacterium]
MRLLLPVLVLLAAVPLRAAEDAGKLFADYWAEQMRLSPLTATFYGEPGRDAELDDNGPAGRAARKASAEALLKRARAVDRKALDAEARLSVDVLKDMLQEELAGLALPFHELELDHMSGPSSWIPTVIQTAQPMKTAEDAAALEKRLKLVPGYYRLHRENLAAGLASGRVAARVPATKLLSQLDEMISTPADKTPYAEAAARLPEPLRAEWTPRLLKVVSDEIHPELVRWAAWLKNDYLPKTRDGEVGLSGVPGGKALYRRAIRAHTTLEKSPAELHEIGLEEIAGIRSEMSQIARRAGHAGDLESFLDAARKDPKNFFKSREELKASADSLIAEIKTKLPEWFGTMPRTDIVVKPVEEYREKNEGAAFYFQPPTDLSRPGVYYINTYRPETRSRLSMTSLALHEAVPGHHFQIALALENKALPQFRRSAGYTAYIEGWALYTERLGDEMGLYKNDLSRLGMLSDQALRACRLVVDTGLHAKGWTREKAVEYMKANTPMSQEEIESEVDRYTVWPGQALAYKVGQREIMALREEARSRAGRRFDVKAFHDAVLRHGPLPLPVLRASVLEAFPAK